jgi:hypothetical protein
VLSNLGIFPRQPGITAFLIFLRRSFTRVVIVVASIQGTIPFWPYYLSCQLTYASTCRSSAFDDGRTDWKVVVYDFDVTQVTVVFAV